MKMLKWAGVILKIDKFIRGSVKVASVPEKMWENWFKWCGHVERREEYHMVSQILDKFHEDKRGTSATKLEEYDHVGHIIAEFGRKDGTERQKITRRADPNWNGTHRQEEVSKYTKEWLQLLKK